MKEKWLTARQHIQRYGPTGLRASSMRTIREKADEIMDREGLVPGEHKLFRRGKGWISIPTYPYAVLTEAKDGVL